MSLANFLFSLNGRTRRLHYWLFALALIAFQLVVVAVLAPSMFSETAPAKPPLFITLMSLVLLFPSMAVTIKRTNDINWSPMWAYGITAACAAFVLGDEFGAFATMSPLLTALYVAAILITSVAAVVIGCIRSVHGENAHGASPLMAAA